MKILVTNDDGIEALGIRSLVKALAQEHEIYVVAPNRERSATGHALTLDKPLRVDQVSMDIPNTYAWKTTGTPVDCIKLATCSILTEKMDEIDLVITGINHGPNLGADVLYSGTVNSALEAAMYSKPAIAMSLTKIHDPRPDFSSATDFITSFLADYPKLKMPRNTVLNINVPEHADSSLSNIRITELGTRTYCDNYEKRVDPRGQVYYWLAGNPIEEGETCTTDVMAVKHGHISITPLHYNLSDFDLITELAKSYKKNGLKED